MMELCQRVLDGMGIPEDWKTSVVIPMFKGKGMLMSCGAYMGVKLLDHTGEENKNVNKYRQYAIWLYARERDDGCFVYLKKDAGGILR